jgi:hypothetical protein
MPNEIDAAIAGLRELDRLGDDFDKRTRGTFTASDHDYVPLGDATFNNRAHLKALLAFAERAKAAVRKAAELAWDASGEGFNGEYTPKVVTPKDIDAMLDEVARQALKPEAKHA